MSYNSIDSLYNIKKGERCFLLGNGPSLTKQNITKLKNEQVFVVNWFAFHKDYHIFNNIYYAIGERSMCRFGRLTPKMHRLHKRNNKTIHIFDKCFRELNDRHEYYPEERLYFMSINRDKDIKDRFNDFGKVVYEYSQLDWGNICYQFHIKRSEITEKLYRTVHALRDARNCIAHTGLVSFDVIDKGILEAQIK